MVEIITAGSAAVKSAGAAGAHRKIGRLALISIVLYNLAVQVDRILEGLQLGRRQISGNPYMAENLSTFAIAELLHVDPGSVANWIDRNLLKAHRTPGGHRRVVAEDLVQFLREQKMPIPPELRSEPTRVLIVDDEPAVARTIAQAITAAHPEYEVAEAQDGFRAGTLVATLRPDVVVLDLRMPGMDGYEVCRLIKSQEITKHAEVLAMTAYPSPESRERILECGARVCLSKPVDMDALIKELEASL